MLPLPLLLSFSLLLSVACSPVPTIEIQLTAQGEGRLNQETADACVETLGQRLDILGIIVYELNYEPNTQQLLLELPADAYQEELLAYLTQDFRLELWPTYRFSDPIIRQTLQTMAADSVAADWLARMNFANGQDYCQAYLPEELASPNWLADFAAFFPAEAAVQVYLGRPSRGNSAINSPSDAPAVYLIDGRAREGELVPITGNEVAAANHRTGYTGEMEVGLEFTETGTTAFAQMTHRAAIDLYRQIAIILNGVVYSAPSVQTAITGGQAVITGNFSAQEAVGMAAILNSGELPIPLEIQSVEQKE